MQLFLYGSFNMGSELQMFFPLILWGKYVTIWNIKMLELKKQQAVYYKLQSLQYLLHRNEEIYAGFFFPIVLLCPLHINDLN